MRALVMTLLLLLTLADAHGQEAPTIDMPKVGGVAHGLSTYTMADGTRTEITWSKGRKHGPIRQVHSSGVVVEEGNYDYGKRAGEWIQRDADGKKIETATYLLGVLHGVRQRREYTKGKADLIESAHYVIGLKHGPATEREPTVGHPVTGDYVRGKRQGLFKSAKGDPAFDSTYVCGWQVPKTGQPYRVARPSACAPPERVDVFAQLTARSKKHAQRLRRTLCEASEVLQIPVHLDRAPIVCRHRTPFPRRGAFLDFWRQSYSPADVLRAFEPQYRPSVSIHGTILHARFGEAIGDVEIVDDRASWGVGGCLVQIDRVNRRVAIADHRRLKATPSYADFALRVLTDVLSPKSPLLDRYSARIASTSDGAVVISLAPNAKHSSVRFVWLHLEFDDVDQLSLTAMSLVPWKGQIHTLHFDGLKAGKSADKRAAGRVPAMRAVLLQHRNTSKYAVVASDKLACEGLVW